MMVAMRLAATSFAITLAGCGKPAVTYENVTTQAAQVASAGAPTAVQLKAADGVTVFGSYYRAERPKALILLFHQAGSSKDEYATIAPRLTAAGYSALAIDQRSGGSLFGRNETAANAPHKPGEKASSAFTLPGFCAAMSNTRAAE